MIKAFYTGVTGASANQTYLDVIGNNIANVQTEGYKHLKPEFVDLLYSNMSQGQEADVMVGSGTKADKTDTIYTPGTMMQTDRQLDFAITEDGFFGIQFEDEILYTRAGSFVVGNIDGENYLMMNGGYVLDQNEEPIVLTEGEPVIPAVYQFANNDDLVQVGNTMFRIDNENAEYEMYEQSPIKQGFVEGSNVNLASEMVRMIQAQRAFQMNSRVIQVADEIQQTINTLKN